MIFILKMNQILKRAQSKVSKKFPALKTIKTKKWRALKTFMFLIFFITNGFKNKKQFIIFNVKTI